MEVIYISHPIRGNPEANIRKILSIYEDILREGHVPVAPHIIAFFAFGSSLTADRDIVARVSEEHIARGFVTSMRLYGDTVSEGMFADMALADKYKIPFHPTTPATHQAFAQYERRRVGLEE